MTENTFRTWDGAKLFYRAWLPNKPTDKALLLFHRGHEHSGRWQETVDSLSLDAVAIFAWDGLASMGDVCAAMTGDLEAMQGLLSDQACPLAGIPRVTLQTRTWARMFTMIVTTNKARPTSTSALR